MPTASDGKDQHADRVIVLKWLGQRYFPNIPGRDLYEEDIQAIVNWEKQYRELFPPVEGEDEKPVTARTIKTALINSGAYEAVEQPKAAEEKTAVKLDVPAPKKEG